MDIFYTIPGNIHPNTYNKIRNELLLFCNSINSYYEKNRFLCRKSDKEIISQSPYLKFNFKELLGYDKLLFPNYKVNLYGNIYLYKGFIRENKKYIFEFFEYLSKEYKINIYIEIKGNTNNIQYECTNGKIISSSYPSFLNYYETNVLYKQFFY